RPTLRGRPPSSIPPPQGDTRPSPRRHRRPGREPRSAAAGAGDDLPEAGQVLVPVLGWDPLPGAGAAAVGVAEEGLLVVVPSAEAGEIVEPGDLGAAEGVS